MKWGTSTWIIFILSAILALTACQSSEPAAAPLPAATLTELPAATPVRTAMPSASPTVISELTAEPTRTPLAAAVAPTPTPAETRGGEVEVRIPYYIAAGGEAPPPDIPECVSRIPFVMTTAETRTMVEGEGVIDCHFVNTPSGQPITFHVMLQFDATLDGELLPPTPSQPSGFLDSYLTLDGAIVQYYTGYPAQAPNPCPEDQPCRTPSNEVIPLPFAYKEGSAINTPWTFILHVP